MKLDQQKNLLVRLLFSIALSLLALILCSCGTPEQNFAKIDSWNAATSHFVNKALYFTGGSPTGPNARGDTADALASVEGFDDYSLKKKYGQDWQKEKYRLQDFCRSLCESNRSSINKKGFAGYDDASLKGKYGTDWAIHRVRLHRYCENAFPCTNIRRATDSLISPSIASINHKYGFIFFYKGRETASIDFAQTLGKYSEESGIGVHAYTTDNKTVPGPFSNSQADFEIKERFFGSSEAEIPTPMLFLKSLRTEEGGVYPVTAKPISYLQLVMRVNEIVKKIVKNEVNR